MKLKLKEILSVEEAEKLKALGFADRLEEETDVEIKTYVDSVIKSAIATLKEEIVKELTPEEVEVPAEGTEAPAEGTEGTEEPSGEPEEGAEETGEFEIEEVSEEEKAANAETVKSLTETINQLRVLIEETK